MADTGSARNQGMDEILASIRRMITEDEADMSSPPSETTAKTTSEPESNVKKLFADKPDATAEAGKGEAEAEAAAKAEAEPAAKAGPEAPADKAGEATTTDEAAEPAAAEATPQEGPKSETPQKAEPEAPEPVKAEPEQPEPVKAEPEQPAPAKAEESPAAPGQSVEEAMAAIVGSLAADSNGQDEPDIIARAEMAAAARAEAAAAQPAEAPTAQPEEPAEAATAQPQGPAEAPTADAGPSEEPSGGALLSPRADAAVKSAFSDLTSTMMSGNARTVDELVEDLLRPMLKQWLDDNLPVLVERLVREEIERVARGRR